MKPHIPGWEPVDNPYNVIHCAPNGYSLHMVVQIVPIYPASPEARHPVFLGKPAMRTALAGDIGRLWDVSRESGASASQVEGTSGRTGLNYLVVGPLHSYTQVG